MKEIKTVDEMIRLLKNRNVTIDKFNDKQFKEYLQKYNYTVVINPYKPIHSNKIVVNGDITSQQHIYENNISCKAYINHFEKDKEVSNFLFGEIYEFEMIFSNLVTKYIIIMKDDFFDNINYKISDTYERYCNNGKNTLEDKIVEVKKLKLDRILLRSDQQFVHLVKKSKTFEFLLSFNTNPKSEIFSFLNNINIKSTFNEKIILFKLLPHSAQENILSEVKELSGNKYVFENRKQFIICLSSIRAIRNMICHHNSLSYNLIGESRKDIIRNRYENKNGKVKFSKTNLGRILIFFNLTSERGYFAYYNNYFRNVVDLYDLLNIENINTKDEIKNYALFWNIKLN